MGDVSELIHTSYLNGLLGDNKSLDHVNTIFEICGNVGSFGIKNTSAYQDTISRVNTCLNTSKLRTEGLCVLYHIIQDCQTDIFQENAATWGRLLLQILQSHDAVSVLQLTSHVMVALLEHAVAFPELNREFSTSLLPSLLSALLEDKKEWLQGRLVCLSACMSNFPGPCGQVKNKIENLIVPFFSEHHFPCIEAAINCYVLLPKCGGGGNLGIKHTEAWSCYSNKIIGSLHDVLDGIYKDYETGLQDYKVPELRLQLGPVAEIEPQHSFVLQARFRILTKCLNRMLSEEFPATVKLPMDSILGVICRTLAMTNKILLSRPSLERCTLASMLPSLHIEAFRLLSALIQGAQSLLIPDNPVVNKLFSQSLKWTGTAEIGYGQAKPYEPLRCQIFETLTVWLQVLGASSGLETVADDIIGHILKDITPPVDNIKTDDSSQKRADTFNPPQGKKRKRQNFGDIGQFTNQRKLNRNANKKLCTIALEALKLCIQRLGPFLKSKNHKSIQEAVIPLLLDIQRRPDDLPIPYQDHECRKMLYHVLLATVLVPHTRWPAPIQCAVKIYSLGLLDRNLEVSNFCAECLSVCESIIHPRAPTLNIAVAIDESILSKKDSNKSENENSSTWSDKIETVLNTAQLVPESSVEKEKSQSTILSNTESSDLVDTEIPSKGSDECSSDQSDEEKDESNDEMEAEASECSNEEKDTRTETDQENSENKECTKDKSENEETSRTDYEDNGQPSCTSQPQPSTSSTDADNDTSQERNIGRNVLKRKLSSENNDEESVAKKQVDEADLMLTSFVDAEPDSD